MVVWRTLQMAALGQTAASDGIRWRQRRLQKRSKKRRSIGQRCSHNPKYLLVLQVCCKDTGTNNLIQLICVANGWQGCSHRAYEGPMRRCPNVVPRNALSALGRQWSNQ
jgi:hypothetical protein